MDIRKLKTDTAAEEEGVWTQVLVFDAVLEMRIARAGNRRYMAMRDRLMKPHLLRVRAGTLPRDVSEKIDIECLATTVLLGWRGLKNGDEEFAYTPENAVLLLTEYSDVRRAVEAAAYDAEAYRAAVQEDSAGN